MTMLALLCKWLCSISTEVFNKPVESDTWIIDKRLKQDKGNLSIESDDAKEYNTSLSLQSKGHCHTHFNGKHF